MAKDYDKAISLYHGIIEGDLESASLFANLSQAYFKKGDFAQARLYIERALKLSPRNKDFNANRDVIEYSIASDVSTIDDFFLMRWWQAWRILFGSALWALLGFVGLLISLFSLYKVLLAKEDRKSFYIRMGVIALVCSFLFIMTAHSRYLWDKSQSEAVVMNALTLKSGPDDRSDDLRSIVPGEKVKVIDQIGEWNKVSLKNKSLGWIQTKNLSII